MGYLYKFACLNCQYRTICFMQSKHTQCKTGVYDFSHFDSGLHKGKTFIICLGFSLRHTRSNENDLGGRCELLPHAVCVGSQAEVQSHYCVDSVKYNTVCTAKRTKQECE